MRLNLLTSLFSFFLTSAFVMVGIPAKSSAGIVFSVSIAPPALPVYEQPVCPGDGYIWTPGYWAYADEGYFWVPGTWVQAPEPGFLWTPGYWGWNNSLFIFHEGYWGLQVGFYGGVNYGFGYVGNGYEGGYWNHGSFFYNRSVNNVRHVTNVYNKTVINNVTINRVSYNGGAGGISARATPQEISAERERHVPPTAAQGQHIQTASTNQRLYEKVNQGRPPIAATAKPTEFNGRGAMPAKSAAATYQPPAARTGVAQTQREANVTDRSSNAQPAPRSGPVVHPNDLPQQHPTAPNTGNAKLDKKYQQQQAKVFAKQDQERQQLQAKQDQEHQRMAKQKPSAVSQQHVEQKHQQQTQQLAQKHAQQQQKLEAKQPVPAHNPSKPQK